MSCHRRGPGGLSISWHLTDSVSNTSSRRDPSRTNGATVVGHFTLVTRTGRPLPGYGYNGRTRRLHETRPVYTGWRLCRNLDRVRERVRCCRSPVAPAIRYRDTVGNLQPIGRRRGRGYRTDPPGCGATADAITQLHPRIPQRRCPADGAVLVVGTVNPARRCRDRIAGRSSTGGGQRTSGRAPYRVVTASLLTIWGTTHRDQDSRGIGKRENQSLRTGRDGGRDMTCAVRHRRDVALRADE